MKRLLLMMLLIPVPALAQAPQATAPGQPLVPGRMQGHFGLNGKDLKGRTL